MLVGRARAVFHLGGKFKIEALTRSQVIGGLLIQCKGIRASILVQYQRTVGCDNSLYILAYIILRHGIAGDVNLYGIPFNMIWLTVVESSGCDGFAKMQEIVSCAVRNDTESQRISTIGIAGGCAKAALHFYTLSIGGDIVVGIVVLRGGAVTVARQLSADPLSAHAGIAQMQLLPGDLRRVVSPVDGNGQAVAGRAAVAVAHRVAEGLRQGLVHAQGLHRAVGVVQGIGVGAVGRQGKAAVASSGVGLGFIDRGV